MQQIQLHLPEDLRSDIDFIKAELKELKQNFQPKEPKTYLSRQETADLLKVDLSTLYNWHKRKILIPNGIGNRVLYLREDIENAIVELKK